MGDMIADGAEFTCTLCDSKIKMIVPSCSTTGDGKKIANKSNHILLPAPMCKICPQAPPPCVPDVTITDPGQSPNDIDDVKGLGKGCSGMCSRGGSVKLSDPAQKVFQHDGAGSASAIAAITGAVVDAAGSSGGGDDDDEDEKERKRQEMNKEYDDDFDGPETRTRDKVDGVSREREVYTRKDIDWNLKRDDGLTNLEAAKLGKAPKRKIGEGKFENVELHHHRQDKDGPLVELWRSQHRKVKHDAPRPSWRKKFPDEARRYESEVGRHWKWRASQVQ